VGPGTTSITAESNGVIASSDLTVTTASSGPGDGTPTLTVIPATGSALVTEKGETTQFIAVGNLSGIGVTQDLTNRVIWSSSDVSVATIDQGGLATGVNATSANNTTTITAIATTAGGSIITATSTLATVSPGGNVNLPTLAIYKVEPGTGTVTSSPVGITCGPQATCTGYFPSGSNVILTVHPDTGISFGGWSANCIGIVGAATDPTSRAPLQCQVQMVNNDTVGAIFNQAP
jgi:Divergent InlB B-repeat domain